MNIFKVGDRVKSILKEEYYGVRYGDVGTVRENSTSPFVRWDRTGKIVAFSEGALRRIYAYEDLKKAPVGTKITFENENILLKYELDKFINLSVIRDIRDLNNLKDNFGKLGKIIKIEEPTYTTFYESKAEILDEAEKIYLRGVIRPFRNKIRGITKKIDRFKKENFVSMEVMNDININLPSFKKDTMYKGMKLNKGYTLEELGL